MGILKLVSFLEETFGIETDDDDMVPENFESLAALCAFVERRRSA
jgi:acyl carrier protein